jgi:hypothetical protein
MSKQEEILQKMLEQKESSQELSTANSTSKVGLLRQILYIVSFAIASLYELFEIHKKEVAEISEDKEPHQENWYEQKAFDYQFGHVLISDTDNYNNTALTDQEIETSKVIKYAVAVEEKDKSTLYIKIADKDKQPLSEVQQTAFESYINDVADMGVHISVVNKVADSLKLELDVYYDQAVLSSEGLLLKDTNVSPVVNAVNLYLDNLDFNEQYINMLLVDQLQQTTGVKIAEVTAAYYKYDVLSWQSIKGRYVPKSGHLKITAEDLIVNYIKL